MYSPPICIYNPDPCKPVTDQNTKQRSLGCQPTVLKNTTCVFIKNKITNMHSQWMPPLWCPWVENLWGDILVDARFLIMRCSAYGHNTVHDYGFWLSGTTILEEPTASRFLWNIRNYPLNYRAWHLHIYCYKNITVSWQGHLIVDHNSMYAKSCSWRRNQ
jgi:hypothetical protein